MAARTPFIHVFLGHPLFPQYPDDSIIYQSQLNGGMSLGTFVKH
jgi:hypothetical protein